MDARNELYVGGEWRPPASGESVPLVSPHTGEVFASAPAADREDVDSAVNAARKVQDESDWPYLPASERVEALRRLIAGYAERRREMATLISNQMGSPISFAKFAQAMLPMAIMDAYANLADHFEWETTRTGAFGQDIIVRKESAGVVAAIVPWNMPQFLIATKLAPALLAGCSIIIKPAGETPLDALLLAEVIDGIGIPPGVVSILPGGREVGEMLVADSGVDKVAFTGSTAAGRQVAARCGQDLKRVSLELGGKSAAIVLDDADPASTAAGVKIAGLMNSGQACVAQTRVLVPAARQDEFVEALAAMVGELVVGDPADPTSEIGPLVTQRQQQRVRAFIEAGVQAGARLVAGGSDAPAGLDRGWYVRPTLFADVDNQMSIAREEIFGPVLTVIPYDDTAHAIQIANDSDYGLSGSVWTNDAERGLAVARRIRAGSFGVNEPYSMDPAAPFGGMKASGIGRELGPEGLDGYLEFKSISVSPST